VDPLIDHLLHGGELSVLLLLLWRGAKFINRLDSVNKDYPPHRHIGDRIIYPRDFPPAETEHGD
jgi:hypothetical protein